MTLKGQLRKWVERTAGVRIVRSLPHGNDVFYDLAQRAPGFACSVIFDVGANHGQSVAKLRQAAPGSRIYCFEPIDSAFAELLSTTRGVHGVSCHKLALGAHAGSERMARQGSTTTHFVLREGDDQAPSGSTVESIAMATLDGFCDEHGIASIDYLKIDTEGSDLDVLLGGERMLREHRVAVVEVEAGMGPTNHRHVPFERLKAQLEASSYLLFGIYEQVWEWPLGAPNLRRSNCVFLSKTLIERYTRR